MKSLGLLVLAAGVGVAAAFGARLSEPAAEEVFDRGRAALLRAAAEEARGTYCTALGAIERDPGACGEEPDPKGPMPTDLSQELAGLRATWATRANRAVEAEGVASRIRTPGPTLRLRRWFGRNGVPFLAGVLLIVAGAIVTRRADRARARGAGAAEEGEAPATLQEAVERLLEEVGALRAQMATGEPQQSASLKDELDRLRFERIEPVVEARLRYQRQLGMERFARAFGPFSSAERALYRAWSALVDGAPKETERALETAEIRLREARDALSAGAAG